MDIQLLREVSDFLEEFYEDASYEDELCGGFEEELCVEFEPEPEPEAPVLDASEQYRPHRPRKAASFGSGYVTIEESCCSIPEIVPEKNFSDTLFGLIDARGITDGQAANRSGIDRRLMSKIRNNPNHTPTKKTIFSFAVGLKLSEEETEELLMKAGYAFSNSSKFDLILQYFIREKNYDIWTINEVLNYYGLEPVCC